MKLIVATKNSHKTREIHTLLEDKIQVMTLKDIGFTDEILETGNTFEENAKIKALKVFEFIQSKRKGEKESFVLLADDSGLEVDFLKGAPGVISARYAGEPSNDSANNEKLLRALKDVPGPKRTAQFRCVLAATAVAVKSEIRNPKSENSIQIFEGICRGKIGFKPKGVNGFGYDPIFFPEGFCRTYAELTAEEKNQISHRAKAMAKFKGWLIKLKRR